MRCGAQTAALRAARAMTAASLCVVVQHWSHVTSIEQAISQHHTLAGRAQLHAYARRTVVLAAGAKDGAFALLALWSWRKEAQRLHSERTSTAMANRLEACLALSHLHLLLIGFLRAWRGVVVNLTQKRRCEDLVALTIRRGFPTGRQLCLLEVLNAWTRQTAKSATSRDRLLRLQSLCIGSVLRDWFLAWGRHLCSYRMRCGAQTAALRAARAMTAASLCVVVQHWSHVTSIEQAISQHHTLAGRTAEVMGTGLVFARTVLVLRSWRQYISQQAMGCRLRQFQQRQLFGQASTCQLLQLQLVYHLWQLEAMRSSKEMQICDQAASGLQSLAEGLLHEELDAYLPLAEGDRIRCGKTHLVGTVRFVGPAGFAEGIWVGVELDGAFGKNDGSVHGRHYFHCPQRHGLFIKLAAASKLEEEARSGTKSTGSRKQSKDTEPTASHIAEKTAAVEGAAQTEATIPRGDSEGEGCRSASAIADISLEAAQATIRSLQLQWAQAAMKAESAEEACVKCEAQLQEAHLRALADADAFAVKLAAREDESSEGQLESRAVMQGMQQRCTQEGVRAAAAEEAWVRCEARAESLEQLASVEELAAQLAREEIEAHLQAQNAAEDDLRSALEEARLELAAQHTKALKSAHAVVEEEGESMRQQLLSLQPTRNELEEADERAPRRYADSQAEQQEQLCAQEQAVVCTMRRALQEMHEAEKLGLQEELRQVLASSVASASKLEEQHRRHMHAETQATVEMAQSLWQEKHADELRKIQEENAQARREEAASWHQEREELQVEQQAAMSQMQLLLEERHAAEVLHVEEEQDKLQRKDAISRGEMRQQLLAEEQAAVQKVETSLQERHEVELRLLQETHSVDLECLSQKLLSQVGRLRQRLDSQSTTADTEVVRERQLRQVAEKRTGDLELLLATVSPSEHKALMNGQSGALGVMQKRKDQLATWLQGASNSNDEALPVCW
eukprot:TRINITY_DN32691_c0_g1_i1.p1 TRINITY_DN32691_c0_g1~~TRINITY_DN32691_c0_g1_i1.p1  ORF type:complete len:1122 (+),score=265.26 TRINITY_DN32691_c0_g1_i1:477-3368(+)